MIKFKINMWKYVPSEYSFIDGSFTRKDDYMDIYIFDTRKEMYAFGEDNGITQGETFRALCFTCSNVTRDEVTDNFKCFENYCGCLLFNKKDLGAGTIAHECSHAVLSYFNRRIENYKGVFVDDINSRENENKTLTSGVLNESYCYMIGSIVRQINHNIIKLKL